MSDRNATCVDEPRGDGTPEWEVFVREDPTEPLRHVGSVSAPTAAVAREQVSSLFGWTAETLWLCPAAEVARFTDRDFGAETDRNGGCTAASAGPTDGGSPSERP